ncbi:2Fe-2S iron-sulfur cluster-binding protein [Trinickia dinghuensis]|uniref:2Fe-2S iron-sulfur cluster-binding protein n=1 Tax=Trinickia dinghuensis TaxID=2291023 RepID=UPI00269E067B
MISPPSRPTPTVRVEPHGYTFESPGSLTLLEAAAAARVRLPRSCRNGTCRTCLCKLVAGEVRYRIEWPGLTREEKAEGLILPCVAVAETDLVLWVPDAEPL